MKFRFAALAIGAALVAGACGSDNSSSSTATTAAGATTIAAVTLPATTDSLTVGSANFPENKLLAEIYAQALEAKGVKITRKLDIGNRETYYAAINNGELDVFPEYTNSLLSYVERLKDKAAVPKATNIEEQVTELKANLPSNLDVLTASTAEDKDVIVCTADVAAKYNLKTLEDLAKNAANIKIGGPPEFATRSPFGIVGFKDILGATFQSFTPLEIGTPLVDAMKSKAVDCGNLFSTMSVITTNNFVALDDSTNLVPNEAVIPLVVKAKVGADAAADLDAVSAKLNTDGLKEMMVEIEVDKKAEADVAKEWLKANGFVP